MGEPSAGPRLVKEGDDLAIREKPGPDRSGSGRQGIKTISSVDPRLLKLTKQIIRERPIDSASESANSSVDLIEKFLIASNPSNKAVIPSIESQAVK